MNIINNNIRWLEGFAQKNPSYRRQVTDCLETFKTLESFQGLKETIDALCRSIPQSARMFEENPLQKQFKSWQNELLLLQEGYRTAKQSLDFEFGYERLPVNHLISFIKNLLDDPNILLHYRSLSLFKFLEDPQAINEILKHLSGLGEVPFPDNPKPNTFEAIEPVNEEHAECIRLLCNNSAAMTVDNERSQKANGLLQTMLKIHLDLQHPDFNPPTNSQSGCTIL